MIVVVTIISKLSIILLAAAGCLKSVRITVLSFRLMALGIDVNGKYFVTRKTVPKTKPKINGKN